MGELRPRLKELITAAPAATPPSSASTTALPLIYRDFSVPPTTGLTETLTTPRMAAVKRRNDYVKVRPLSSGRPISEVSSVAAAMAMTEENRTQQQQQQRAPSSRPVSTASGQGRMRFASSSSLGYTYFYMMQFVKGVKKFIS
jgi:hypothetical protein